MRPNHALDIVDMLPSAELPKNAALQAVGRTIVNFQRLEHNLKLAAQLGPLQGTFHKIQSDIEKHRGRAQTMTLGQAIQSWLAYCGGTRTPSEWTPDLFDVSMQMSFSLESDSNTRSAHAMALSSLLETRNDLIHSRLVEFAWESPDACHALIQELNAVNSRISKQLDYVTTLLREILSLQRESAEAVLVECGEAAATSQPRSNGRGR